MRIFKIAAYFVFILLAIVVLAPKRHLYDIAQQEMKKYDLVISGEKIKDKFLSLELENGEIWAKDILSANFGNVLVYPFLAFNQIKIQNLKTSKNLQNIISLNIQEASINQVFWNPLKLELKAIGDFGEASGFVSLKDKNGTILIAPSAGFEATLTKFGQIKKDQSGVYKYEFSY